MPIVKVKAGQTIKLSKIDPNDTGKIKSKKRTFTPIEGRQRTDFIFFRCNIFL